jgi:hypothetical protein
MLLKDACDIAEECGLETIGEAIMNIQIHALSIFNYNEEKKELNELYNDFKTSGLTIEDNINIILKHHKN